MIRKSKTFVIRYCENCNTSFYAVKYRVKIGWGRFCSRNCWYSWLRKNPSANMLRASKINVKKATQIWSGKHHSQATKNKMSKKLKGKTIENRHGMWKGDSVGLSALHKWVYRRLGQPNKCEICETSEGNFNWHNISHEYKRDLDDWIRVCITCHNNLHKKKQRKYLYAEA